MVVGDTDLIPTDDAVLARLEQQLTVDIIGHDEAEPEDAEGKALVMVTSSVTVPFTGTKFRDVRVPLILLEPNLMGLMGLTDEPASDHGATQRTETEIRIVDDQHPLAGGLDGDVTVYESPWRLTWGVPAPAAVKIATLVDDPDRVVIFAYQAGAEMVIGPAPAKRLAFFLHDNQADENLTDDALTLLDAAIRWMLE
jgi:hypothetical protein